MDSLDLKDLSRHLQSNCMISCFFQLYLMLYEYVWIFDMMSNIENYRLIRFKRDDSNVWAPRIEFRRFAWGCNTKHIQPVTRCVVHQSTIETPKLSIGIEISSSTWYPPVVGELNSDQPKKERKQRQSAWIPT